MFTLYATKGSVGSAAVEAALTLVNVKFDLIDAAPWSLGPNVDRLRFLNPLTQVPTLVSPTGEVMTESAAILIHLGLKFPSSGLLPTATWPRAQNIRGLVFIAANCYPDISVMDFPERYYAGCGDDERRRIRSATIQHLHMLWRSFAEAFPGKPFLAGDRVGALDLLAASVSKCFGSRVHLREQVPGFAELMHRVDEDSRFREVHDRHWPPSASS